MPSSWTRVADRVVVWDPSPPAAGADARRAAPLYLVTQVGRMFQAEHPEVRPLLDHGRHLVVQGLDPALVDRHDTCWRVEPLPPDQVVVDVVGRRAGRADPATVALLAQLDPARYEADVRWLAALPTRHSTSAGFRQAADWAATRLADLGCAVTRQTVAVGAGTSQNIIGERAGTGAEPRDVVMVVAHLDSINITGGPGASAPGADDNASGSAGVLELGRVLAGQAWQSDLRLVLFGGEEQGLFGSRHYVATLPGSERARIRAVLNMDMVASQNAAVPTVLLEGADVSSGLMIDLAAAAATYTSLTVETSLNPFASDHVPFIEAGMPALLTIEGTDSANGNVHTASDEPGYLDVALADEILEMNLASLARWLRPATPRRAPQPAGSVVSWGEGRIDVFVTG